MDFDEHALKGLFQRRSVTKSIVFQVVFVEHAQCADQKMCRGIVCRNLKLRTVCTNHEHEVFLLCASSKKKPVCDKQINNSPYLSTEINFCTH